MVGLLDANKQVHEGGKMLNTIGLWIILISSILVFVLMLLYANGVFAKVKKSILERKKAKAKKEQKKEKQLLEKEISPSLEETEGDSLDKATSMGDLQSIFWKKKG